MTKFHLFSISAKICVICLTLGSWSILFAQTPGTLYGSTGSSSNQLITIDPTTGAGTLVDSISGTPSGVTEIEFREDGVLFGTVGQGLSQIFTINPLNGNATLVGTHPFGAVNGMDFDSGGNLVGSFFNPGVSTDLVIIDQATGGFTSTIGVIFPSDVVTGLTFDSGGTLYGIGRAASGGSPSSLYTIDPITAIPTLVGPIGFDNVGAIEFGPDGILYGGVGITGANAGALISISTSTGAGTLIGPTGFLAISGLSFVPGIVPVELSSFTASTSTEYVILNWETATEINNSGFQIERSYNKINFETIGFVPGFGTSSEPKSYSFTDNNVISGLYLL